MRFRQDSPNPRYIDRNKIRCFLIKTETITQTNSVLHAAGNIIAEMVGYKNKEMTENKHQKWGRQILEKQKALRKELRQLNMTRRKELQNKGIISKFEKKTQFQTEVEVVHQKVRQRLAAVGEKLERYDNRTEQYLQNRLFESNQKRLFNELEATQRQMRPDARESKC